MTREKSPDREKALKIWLKSGRQKKLSEIAAELGLNPSMVRKWKSVDKWDEIPETGRQRGAPKGNRNAKGNKGGPGGPKGNSKAVTHGFFRKFMPQNSEYLEIMDAVENMDPVDMIWYNITTQFRAIVWAQRIMFVNDQGEMIKELKKQKFEIHNNGTKKEPDLVQMVTEEEHEFQFAWDRYATYLKAQSAAMSELRSAIKQFKAIAPEEDERRIKLEGMQAQIEKTRLQIEELKNGDNDKPTEINVKRWSNVTRP
ncbi:phage terminase small subunit [Paenibacillus graminis]|uniref:phage terminase small subunit n=1 Tax=Paenibacillus graminis TaxID=189425 RepID=UPI002DBD79E2|nr:phage terminase small subunit [Paenibacillus graminis]MEC0169733.1 phage terminase small subunit [Paenibacillus graminis]